MNLIDRLNSQEELFAFRDHLANVLSEKLSIPLKARKLDEFVSAVVGAVNFNTALGIVNKPVTSTMDVVRKSAISTDSRENLFSSFNVPDDVSILDAFWPTRNDLDGVTTSVDVIHRPIIQAFLVTNDNCLRQEFDAEPFFRAQLLTGDEELADTIATFMAARFRVTHEDLNVLDCLGLQRFGINTITEYVKLKEYVSPTAEEAPTFSWRGYSDRNYDCIVEHAFLIQWLERWGYGIMADWVKSDMLGFDSITAYHEDSGQDPDLYSNATREKIIKMDWLLNRKKLQRRARSMSR